MGMIIFSSEVVKSFQSLYGNTRELSEPSLGNIKKMKQQKKYKIFFFLDCIITDDNFSQASFFLTITSEYLGGLFMKP